MTYQKVKDSAIIATEKNDSIEARVLCVEILILKFILFVYLYATFHTFYQKNCKSLEDKQIF